MSTGFFTNYDNCCCPTPGFPSCPHGWVDVLAVVNDPPTNPDTTRYYLVGEDPTGAFAGHANQYASYDALGATWVFCLPRDGDKLTVDGSCDISCFDGSTWVVITAQNLVLSGQNVGAGGGQVFKQWAGGQLQLRRIRGTGAATVTTNGDDVIINVNQIIPTGEVNSGENIGLGARVFGQKAGPNLQFRRLLSADSGLTITEQTSTVLFRVNFPSPPTIPVYTAASLGSNVDGLEVYAGTVGNQFQFHRLRPGANVVITDSGDYLTISATVPPGTGDTDLANAAINGAGVMGALEWYQSKVINYVPVIASVAGGATHSFDVTAPKTILTLLGTNCTITWGGVPDDCERTFEIVNGSSPAIQVPIYYQAGLWSKNDNITHPTQLPPGGRVSIICRFYEGKMNIVNVQGNVISI